MAHRRTCRLLIATALTGIGLTTAACDGAATRDNPKPTPSAEAVPAAWPDSDFPIPPGVTVTERSTADTVGILLIGEKPEKVIDFYRSALPTAGYQITEDNSVGLGQLQVAGLTFTGHDYRGELTVVSNTVSVSIHKS